MLINRRIIVYLILTLLTGKNLGTRSKGRHKKVDSLLAGEEKRKEIGTLAPSLLQQEGQQLAPSLLQQERQQLAPSLLQQDGQQLAPSLLTTESQKRKLAPSLLQQEEQLKQEQKEELTPSLLHKTQLAWSLSRQKQLASSLLPQKKQLAPSLLQKGEKASSLLQHGKLAPSLLENGEKAPSLLQKAEKAQSLVQHEKKAQSLVQPGKLAPSLLSPTEKEQKEAMKKIIREFAARNLRTDGKASSSKGRRPPRSGQTVSSADLSRIIGQGMNIIKWNSPIYYSIEKNYLPDERDRLVKAMTIWANNSCLKFEENPSARPLLQFVRDDYCHTYYGAPSEAENGIRVVYLGANCLMLSQIVHEIGHALGMIHTQQRTDRDNFIIVHYENVQPDYRVFYEKMVDSQSHGMPYDIGSVMHYSSDSYAIDNNSPTMVPIDPLYRHVIYGQSRGLTFADILLINTFYQCQLTCAQQGAVVVCSHGGIPNPNNCSQCICPSGFGGSRCEINAPATYLPWMKNDGSLANCGGILRATATAKNLYASINVPAFTQLEENLVDNYAACHWHIQADTGKRVAIQIEAISEDRCSDLCHYGNLDVKTKSDLRLTGYRFCCKSDLGLLEGRLELVSESDLAVVSINSNHLKMEATLKYWQI